MGNNATIIEEYLARVTDIADPEKRGRIKVISGSYAGDLELPEWIEPEHLWFDSQVINIGGEELGNGGIFFPPNEDSLVKIRVTTTSPYDESYQQTALDSPDIVWIPLFRMGETDNLPNVFTEYNYGQRRGIATPYGSVLLFDDTQGFSFHASPDKEQDGINMVSVGNLPNELEGNFDPNFHGAFVLSNAGILTIGRNIFQNGDTGIFFSEMNDRGNLVIGTFPATGIDGVLLKESNQEIYIYFSDADGSITIRDDILGVTYFEADGSGNLALGDNGLTQVTINGTQVDINNGTFGAARINDTVSAAPNMTAWLATVTAVIATFVPGTVVPTDFGTITSGSSTVVIGG